VIESQGFSPNLALVVETANKTVVVLAGCLMARGLARHKKGMSPHSKTGGHRLLTRFSAVIDRRYNYFFSRRVLSLVNVAA